MALAPTGTTNNMQPTPRSEQLTMTQHSPTRAEHAQGQDNKPANFVASAAPNPHVCTHNTHTRTSTGYSVGPRSWVTAAGYMVAPAMAPHMHFSPQSVWGPACDTRGKHNKSPCSAPPSNLRRTSGAAFQPSMRQHCQCAHCSPHGCEHIARSRGPLLPCGKTTCHNTQTPPLANHGNTAQTSTTNTQLPWPHAERRSNNTAVPNKPPSLTHPPTTTTTKPPHRAATRASNDSNQQVLRN